MNFPGIKLDDVLGRLGDSEEQVCALASFTPNGWGTLLGWSPAAKFQAGPDANQTARNLEAFVAKQGAAGRLVIGYLSYDFGCALHRVTLNAKTVSSLPLVTALAFDSWLHFDETGAQIAGSNSQAFITAVQTIMARPLSARSHSSPQLAPVQSREWVRCSVSEDHRLHQGWRYVPINLGHRLTGITKLGGRELFRSLTPNSQVDFQAYLEIDQGEILSFSPERFIRTRHSTIETFPVKGTRPRGTTDAKDQALKADLLTNPKDRAELDMITDLLRNDLGVVCQPGSIKVSEPRTLSAYPTLWHAHSAISGRLLKDVSPMAALISMSPGGSITGCPKKRAIEIIDELEPERRGAYTGSIFVIDPASGNLDSSILIRTIIKPNPHRHSVQIGDFNEMLHVERLNGGDKLRLVMHQNFGGIGGPKSAAQQGGMVSDHARL